MRGVGRSRPNRRAFTLLEILIATAVLSVVMVVALSVLGQTSAVWQRASSNVEAFQSARLGFDLLVRNLSQATLNTYLDYDNPTAPTRYLRKSDLHFVIGRAGTNGLPGSAGTGDAVFFQMPTDHTDDAAAFGGLDAMLGVCGYFVEFGQNTWQPPFVAGTGNFRFRLMQWMVPGEQNRIFQCTGPGATLPERAWIDDGVAVPVAENVIALIVLPQDPANSALFAAGGYDSRLAATTWPQPPSAHQLPPILRIAMVAIDERSARRLESGGSPPSAITTALSGKFMVPANLEDDLVQIQEELNAANIQSRVFSSAIPMRESKWTR